MALTNPNDRLVAAILLGNPSHYPGQNVRELSGSATAEAIGLGAYLYLMRRLGAEAQPRSRRAAMRPPTRCARPATWSVTPASRWANCWWGPPR
ncbi:Uncharacterised protein [Mycobacteroides abscessus subsp. abscessus]|nr:Uncharacterised protein [Mycobacteroides abscessus subsp. abscessus]